MKKFVTGSLIAAGIFAVVGVVFCLVSGIIGGRNLFYLIQNDDYLEEKLERTGEKLEHWIERAEGWHLVYHESNPKELRVNDQVVEITGSQDAGAEAQYPTDGIRKLDLMLGAGSFVIKEKDTDDGMIDLYIQGRGGCDYRLKEDTFYVEGFKGIKTIGSDLSENVITMVIPSGMKFEEIDVEVGAGVMEISGLHAREMDAVIGAGELYVNGMEAAEFSAEVGVGRIEAADVNAGDVSITVSVGEGIYEGSASGNIDVECAMGNLELSLREREDTFNYEIECGVGTLEIGNNVFSGLATERKVDHGAYREFDVECSAGNIVIRFQE